MTSDERGLDHLFGKQASTTLVGAVASRYWMFSQKGRPLACERMTFLPDGKVGGYHNPNEATWSADADSITLYHTTGRITAVLKLVSSTRENIRLEGPSLGAESAPLLCLEAQPESYVPMAPASTRKHLEGRHLQAGQWSIGDYTYGAPMVLEPHCANLSIGRFCSIASNVTIVLGGHNHRFVSTYPFTSLRRDWDYAPDVNDHVSRGDVAIGNDVWVGDGAYIQSGVTVGDGSIIGSNSVVTRDVPPYAIVAGSPAQVRSYRFAEPIIARLLQVRWWDWPKARIDRTLGQILNEDIEAFLELAESDRPDEVDAPVSDRQDNADQPSRRRGWPRLKGRG